MLLQLDEKGFVNVGGVYVAFLLSSLGSPGECRLHSHCIHGLEVDIGRNMRRRGKDLVIGNAVHVVTYRLMHFFERMYGSLRGRPTTTANGGRALGRPAPATLQFIKRRVEFSPLTTGEESPFQGILEPVVVLSISAASDLGSGSKDVRTVENGVLPGPVISSLADQAVESSPITWRDRFPPIVEISKDDPHAPK